MSREIKFRAWREITKMMLPTHHLVDLFTYGNLVNPDQVVWMQFTGLKDKNGVEIYEGDIVKSSLWTCNLTIHYDESLACWFSVDTDSYMEMLSDNIETFEVIGNIHQNPDLIK